MALHNYLINGRSMARGQKHDRFVAVAAVLHDDTASGLLHESSGGDLCSEVLNFLISSPELHFSLSQLSLQSGDLVLTTVWREGGHDERDRGKRSSGPAVQAIVAKQNKTCTLVLQQLHTLYAGT